MFLALRTDTQEVSINDLSGKLVKHQDDILVVKFPGQMGRPTTLHFRDVYIPAHYVIFKVVDIADCGLVHHIQCDRLIEFDVKEASSG